MHVANNAVVSNLSVLVPNLDPTSFVINTYQTMNTLNLLWAFNFSKLSGDERDSITVDDFSPVCLITPFSYNCSPMLITVAVFTGVNDHCQALQMQHST